ncbi:hypothetical protein [Dongia sp.]|uniref:hypothetical protein n=1 Tax=Dongia sp. TaxID=1977262 RepID=UPI003752E2A3
MFGSARRKATKAATEAVRPLIKLLEITDGLPAGFWEDPYVLGYINGCIGLFAKLVTRGAVKGADMGYVMMDVLSDVSGRNGQEIVRNVIRLQQSKDAEYMRGIANADKCISVTYGLTDYDQDPDVVEARRRAPVIRKELSSITGESSENANAGAALQEMLFYDVVRARFGLQE